MDMAIISINNETNILQYSGANNPLYIISDKEIQVIDEEIPTELKLLDNSKLKIESPKFFYEIRPDKMPIGIYEKMDKFKTHEIQLQKGDKLYMFSDGFADQFGGKRGKKFKYKQFKRLLIENTDMSMFELKTILNSTFENWRANNEQVDDVVIVGIEI
jgi:serine phosphatase RsbU (regulator of sigma subunit)